jgi:uncharacterized protein YdeI (YjbR/CyaY-like superfamily)
VCPWRAGARNPPAKLDGDGEGRLSGYRAKVLVRSIVGNGSTTLSPDCYAPERGQPHARVRLEWSSRLKAAKDLPVKRFASRRAWETWLEDHHDSAPGVWLEFARKDSGLRSVSHAEALEVALCYGWIDGQAASVDSQRFRQRFTPRRARSKWSQINCAAVERLHAQGRLAPAGVREMETAKRDGRWEAAYASPRTMTVPDDLRALLEAHPRAQRFFEQLDSRNRYAILYRLQDAKKADTRLRRLEKFVRMLEAGETLH